MLCFNSSPGPSRPTWTERSSGRERKPSKGYFWLFPSLPYPTLPSLPFPTLPYPPFPTLPSLPLPPSLPYPTLPSLPYPPFPTLSSLPFPTLPFLPFPPFPTLPFLPSLPFFPSSLPPFSSLQMRIHGYHSCKGSLMRSRYFQRPTMGLTL